MTAETNPAFSPVMCWCGMGVQITLNDDGSFGVMVALAEGQTLQTADGQAIAPDRKEDGVLRYTMRVQSEAPRPGKAKARRGAAASRKAAAAPRHAL